jgi:hypothetical protein
MVEYACVVGKKVTGGGSDKRREDDDDEKKWMRILTGIGSRSTKP